MSEQKIREYHCRRCKALLLKYGNFKKEFPDYKELRVCQIYKKENIQVRELRNPYNPQQVLCLFVKCRCDVCGRKTIFNVVVANIPNNIRIETHA